MKDSNLSNVRRLLVGVSDIDFAHTYTTSGCYACTRSQSHTHIGDQVNPQRITTRPITRTTTPRRWRFASATNALAKKRRYAQRRLAGGPAGRPAFGGRPACRSRPAAGEPLPFPVSLAGCSRVFFNRWLGAAVGRRSLDKFPIRANVRSGRNRPHIDSMHGTAEIPHPMWVENILPSPEQYIPTIIEVTQAQKTCTRNLHR